MNSYFFFGFHIFKDFTVTFMYQLHPKTILNWNYIISFKAFTLNQKKY